MTKQKKNDGAFKAIAVLVLICIVVSFALAMVNKVTFPVIEEAAAERLAVALGEVLPDGDSFDELEVEGLPATVSSVYRAANGTGYVFILKTMGYGGDMEIACGIGNDGKITACQTLSHSETAGMGSKTAEDPYRSQYNGKDSSLAGVEAISGATISSTAYYKAIEDAFAAFETVKEAA